jgi:FixJ family two-component response regulator
MFAHCRGDRYHVFLLDTTSNQWPTIDRGKNGACKDSMAHPPPGFTVAVVDDDEGILRSLEILLESADYAVRLFHSGTELLEGGGLEEVDCLISDIDMPGMDGFELLRLVHAARPGLPTILITGYPDTLKRLPPLGGSNPRFFTKPFDGPELLTAVSDALRNPRE